MRIVFALLATLVACGCTSAFFHPQRALVATPDLAGVRYESLALRAADGVELIAWFMPAAGKPRATVLFLHGNAENISTHFMNVAWMPAEGFNVLALDYRGYGGSEGKPSLPGMQLDIDAALAALLARPDVDARRIVLFGQSLGGALAIHYGARGARRGALRAVIADSAFADYRAIASEKLAASALTWPFQWLPALTVDNDYSPRASIGAISPLPLLLIHGEADSIVPPHHAQLLYEAARPPKELWMLPGAGHIQSVRDPALRQRLSDYVRRVTREEINERPPVGYDIERQGEYVTGDRPPRAQSPVSSPKGKGAVESMLVPVSKWATWGEEGCSPQPQVGFIEPLVRRRLSFLDRIALHVANACVAEGERVQLVFASRHGELARSAELLAQLARGELPSPMSFSLSVLNAAAGLYGIARKDRSPATAVSSGEATFPLALVEASAQALKNPDATVVLAFADEPPPEVYRPLVDSPRVAHAMAVRLEARKPQRAVELSWSAGEGDDDEPEQAVWRFARSLADGTSGTWSSGGQRWQWSAHGHA